MANGNFHLAVEHLEESIAAAPDNRTALILYGFCLHELERNDEALEYFQTAVTAAPDDLMTNYFLGWILFEQGRCDDALIPLQKAYTLIDQNDDLLPDLLVLLARCSLVQNLPQGKSYLQALRRYHAFANSAELYNALAILYIYDGDYKRAEQNFLTALKMDPDNIVVLQNLGVLYDSYLHQSGKAMTAYRKSLVRTTVLADDATRKVKLRNRLRQLAEERRQTVTPSEEAVVQ